MNTYRQIFITVLLMFKGYMVAASVEDSVMSLVRSLRTEAQSGKLDSITGEIKRLSEASDYATGLAWYYLLHAEKEMYYGNTESSLKLCEKAAYYNKQGTRDPQLFTSIYLTIGILNANAGKNEKAVTLLLHAMNFVEKIKDTKEKERITAIVYLNISRPFMNIGDYTTALHYLEKSQRIAEKNGLYVSLTNILINTGICYEQMNDIKQAEIYLKQGLDYSRKYHLVNFEQSALSNIGSILITQGRYDKAIIYLQQALAIDDGKTPYYTVGVLSSLGTGYYHIKDYLNAEKTLLNALEKAKTFKMNHYMPGIQSNLYRVYEATGKPVLALKHLKAYITVKDSVSGLEQAKNIQQLETRYKSALKDKELAEHQMKLQHRNNQIIILAGLVLLLLILAFATFRHRSKLHKRKIRILQQAHELDAFKSMMQGEEKERIRIAQELHDGIGGMVTALNMKLSSVQKRSETNAPETYRELDNSLSMIRDIAEEIRNTSRNLMPEALLDHGLANALRQYCTYMEKSSNICFDLQFYGDLDRINGSLSLNFYRIVQEIIQNVVKHSGATEAIIQLREHEGILTLHTEDNGTGFDPQDTSNKGLGLANIKSRVMAAKGYFSISSTQEAGTTIYIEVDIKNAMTWDKVLH